MTIARDLQTLPLAEIDRPDLDARIDRDPARIEEIARDILRRGLIYPIHVFAKHPRYEIVDGFTRFLATRQAGLQTIEAFVYPSKDVALEGVKYAANIFRLEMTPVDEAKMFDELLHHECGDDVDRLCALVGKPYGYVSNRLNLLRGDELVLEAVKDGRIKLGVAEQLNKISDASWCRYYLHHAIESGATVGVVTGWVQEWKTQEGQPQRPAAPAETATGGAAPTAYDPYRCYVCGKSDKTRMTVEVRVHNSCREAILDTLLEGVKPEPTPST
jgi:ParB family transcriptional regulator, chromosome partitioning protein